MQYLPLGRTGVVVSRMSLGTMMFGKLGNPDHDECVRIIHRALDAGVNCIDTADFYSLGESEEIVGAALKGRRDDVVLATKFRTPLAPGPNKGGGSRRYIMQAVEANLRRLGTEWIDLYQMHRPDPTCDIDETLGALSDLVHQGKVRMIGSSTVPAEDIVEAQWVAERRNLVRFVTEQCPYSIFSRRVETDVFPTCRRHDMGVIVWGPLNGGWLSGKYRAGREIPENSRAARGLAAGPAVAFHGFYARLFAEDAVNEHKYDLVEQLVKIAEDAGMPLSHLAQAWTLAHPAVSTMLMGPRTLEQIEDSLAAAEVVLDDDLLDRIDAIVSPGAEIGSADVAGASPALAVTARRR